MTTQDERILALVEDLKNEAEALTHHVGEQQRRSVLLQVAVRLENLLAAGRIAQVIDRTQVNAAGQRYMASPGEQVASTSTNVPWRWCVCGLHETRHGEGGDPRACDNFRSAT